MIWRETDGALEWLKSVSEEHHLQPPVVNLDTPSVDAHSARGLSSSSSSLTVSSASKRSKDERDASKKETETDDDVYEQDNDNDNDNGNAVDQHIMFLGMFQTAMDMVAAD